MMIWHYKKAGFWAVTLSGLFWTWDGSNVIGATSAPERSYQSIVERNPFGLQPPRPDPPPVKPQETKPDTKVDILLTGITSLLSPKRAFLMTKDQQGKVKYHTFIENQEIDGLKVLEIDSRNQKVRVNHRGQETLLTFTTHGIKSPSNPNPGAAAATPGQVNANVVQPTGSGQSGNKYSSYIPPALPGSQVSARTYNNKNNNAGLTPIPSRPTRVQPDYNLGFNQGGLGNSGFGAGPSNAGIPDHNNQSKDVPIQTPSPEEAVVLMELQKAAHPDIKFPPTPGLPVPPDYQNPNQTPFPPNLPLPQ